MSTSRWLQTLVALIVLFGAGFVLLGEDRLALPAERSAWAAAASVALLAGDIVLPVPSSVVMTANGRLFGLAAGAAASFVGSMLAWSGCYWLGRLVGWGAQSRRRTAGDDPVSRHLRRFGVLLLIATRPAPIVAELVAASAGVARMNAWRFLLGAALGTAPTCLLYAWIGSRTHGLTASLVALAAAIVLPLSLYAIIARPWRRLPDAAE